MPVEPTREEIAKAYAAALAIINVLRSCNEELSASNAALLESARIDQALQMRGYTKATARALGDDAHHVYLSAGSSGLRDWARQKREAAIAKVEER